MDRKGIIGVTVALVVLILWQVEFAKKFAPPAPAVTQATAGAPGASAAPAASGAPTAQASTAPVSASSPASAAATAAEPVADASSPWPLVVAPTPGAQEQVTTVPGPAGRYHFTNLGGGISQAELVFYPAESGSNVALNVHGTLPIGAISDEWGAAANLPYTVTVHGNTVTCERQEADGLTITKQFTLPASLSDAHGYHINLKVSFSNRGAQPVHSGTDGYYLYVGSAAPIHQNDLPTYTAFDWDAAGSSTHTDVNWFSEAKFPLIGILIHPERPIYSNTTDGVDWTAVSGQYFTTILSGTGSSAATGVWAQRLTLDAVARKYALQGAIRLPAFDLAPGKSVTQSFDYYAGPKIYGVLQGLGGGQDRIITTYFAIFGISALKLVSIFLLNTLNTLHSVTHSYAVAIILLTLCIRIVLWPIQNRATASMRQMQEITPRMNELKEKYKDDPTRMNSEVMKLYKEYNINPLAGCLPMFIQLPIFIGFYRVLGTAIELRGSHFLWVHDLSQPDTVFHIAGYPINILPICMCISTMLQMQLQPKAGDPSQQKMFMFLPLIYLVFCYNFASGLALYLTVQNIFTITQLRITRKRTTPAPFKAPLKRKTR
jgi:YidC/Oxa1 family membrane protein insertase